MQQLHISEMYNLNQQAFPVKQFPIMMSISGQMAPWLHTHLVKKAEELKRLTAIC